MTITALTRARRLTAGLLLGAGLATGGVAYELGQNQNATQASATTGTTAGTSSTDSSVASGTPADTTTQQSDTQQSGFGAVTNPDSTTSGAVASSHGS